jgi:hypothetical protein
MIDAYYWPTPNGHKITMFLEETGIDYRLVPVDIGKGKQFLPELLAISPNNRCPPSWTTNRWRGRERNRLSNPAPFSKSRKMYKTNKIHVCYE